MAPANVVELMPGGGVTSIVAVFGGTPFTVLFTLAVTVADVPTVTAGAIQVVEKNPFAPVVTVSVLVPATPQYPSVPDKPTLAYGTGTPFTS